MDKKKTLLIIFFIIISSIQMFAIENAYVFTDALTFEKDIIRPYPIRPNSKTNITLFYNYIDCPGAVLHISYTELSKVYQKASKEEMAKELLSVIGRNQSKSIPLKCVDFNATGGNNSSKGWTNGGAETGVPLDCNSENIKELLKNELSNINSITANHSSKETAKILCDNYKECVFSNIDIDQRIILLNNLSYEVEYI